jgi:hypothetical protein
LSDIIVEITEEKEIIVEITEEKEIKVDVNTSGPIGPRGYGVPFGGEENQFLKKDSGVDFDTSWHTLVESDISDLQDYALDSDLTTHTEDTTIHFTEASIDHTNIQNIGTNTHAQIDTHIGDSSIHFTVPDIEENIDHTNIQNIGTNTHTQIDTHISDSSIHFSDLSNFDTGDLTEGSNLYYTEARVSANIDVSANTSARHNAVTVTDSSEIGFTLTGQDITATIKSGSIDESKLDTSVNTSLDLADSAVQDVVTSLGYTPENSANKGQNNGYAGLDSGGKLLLENLPTTLLQYQGVWDASTNTPTLTSPDLTKVGYVYNVSVAGTQFGLDFSLGDWLIYNASGEPEKSDNSDDVTSVNTQTGAVVLDADDIDDTSTAHKFVTANDLTNLSNLSGTNTGDVTVTDSSEIDFTLTDQNITASLIAGSIDETKLDTSVNASLDLADSAIQSTDLSTVATTGNHSDLSLDDGTNPHGTTATDVGLGNVEDGAEINNISDTNATDLTDGGDSTLHYHSSDRDRANHTGTQTASTISDFDTEVSNNATVVANSSKVSADGSVTTHNDVTNAGSGAIITTAERNNISTNNSKVSADGSINTHSDVDTTTTAPSNDDVLTWDGSNWVPQAAGGSDVTRLKWADLVTTWTSEPTEEAYSGGDGQVFSYTYGTTAYYRFVPSTYDSTEDKFYSSYSNPTLSGLVATRGNSI